MRSEEPHENGKLLAAKSWFTRSASSVTLQNASIEATSDGVSSGISVSKEGAVESGAGVTSLRQQLAMRVAELSDACSVIAAENPIRDGTRSMGSGEIKKEAGAGSPTMTIKNVTPLTPITPLKWKPNLREQEEEKALERSRLGSAIPVGTICEENPEANPSAEGGKEGRPAESQQHGSPVANELSTEVQPGNIGEDDSLESLEGPDRKTSSGDDVMTMTIEFLRARLLSERSASKTAKLQIQQLAKKVSELEEKLDQALKDQTKAEVTAQEAFMKLKLAESSNQGMNKTVGEVSDGLISTSTKGSPLSRSRAGREDTKYLQQDGSSNKDLSRMNSYGSSVEDGDSSTKRSLSETADKPEERTADQGRPDVRPAPHDMTERSQELPQRHESRAVIESRLRNMWSKISEDMTALAEERRNDVVRKELISWMGLVPAVLQNIIPKELENPTHDVDLSSESERIGLQGVPRQMLDNQPELSPETVQFKDQLHTEVKRAALLHEQFSAKGNIVQQEWQRNYQESQQVEKLKGDALHGSSSPVSSAGYHSRIHQDPTGAPALFAEDGHQSSKPDFRAGESSWDDRDRGHRGRHHQARPRQGDAHGRMERESYYRVSEIEESYSSSQPEITHRHRHRRSHSDHYDWPAVEDYGLLYQQPELSPALGRRQSYSGYPAAMAVDPHRTSFDKPPGSYDDLRYVDERLYRADEHRRNSIPRIKADDVPGQLNSTQRSRNGDSIAEPTLSLGYGPAYDAPPRKDSPVQQSPKAGLNKNISDVLRALQLAKAKIQNGGAGSMGHRPSREQGAPSMKPEYGMEPSAQYIQ